MKYLSETVFLSLLIFTLTLLGCSGTVSHDTASKKTDVVTPIAVDTTNPVLNISNVHENGIFESGCIIGTASDNIELKSLKISIDDSVLLDVDGLSNWKFLLTGSYTKKWTVGSLHTIKAVATDTSNNIGEVTINFRKGVNKDFNGDGYADLAVGCRYYDGTLINQGKLYVYYGNNVKLTSIDASLADVNINSSMYASEYGTAVRYGDINGDGYGDIVVGAPMFDLNTQQGKILIHNGSSSGLSLAPSTTIIGKNNDYLGHTYIVSDINGDGNDDLIVGMPMRNSNKGMVYIFKSALTGIPNRDFINSDGADIIINGSTNGAYFGSDIASGDINGDGYNDISISASSLAIGSYTSAGRVYIFHSSGSSGFANGTDGNANYYFSGTATNQYYGFYLASGDFNGDSLCDLAISSFNNIYILFARSNKTGLFYNSDMITGFASQNKLIQTGYANNDNYADLLVSDYNANLTGSVYLYKGTGSSASIFSPAVSFYGEKDSSMFGSSIIMSDLNSDGFSDIIISAKKYSVDKASRGRLYLFYSANDGSGFVDTNLKTGGACDAMITGDNAGDSFGILYKFLNIN